MNLSAILVITAPAGIEACMSLLNNQPGLSIHHSDPATGKIMLIQEAESVDAEVDGLKRIKALDGVSLVSLMKK